MWAQWEGGHKSIDLISEFLLKSEIYRVFFNCSSPISVLEIKNLTLSVTEFGCSNQLPRTFIHPLYQNNHCWLAFLIHWPANKLTNALIIEQSQCIFRSSPVPSQYPKCLPLPIAKIKTHLPGRRRCCHFDLEKEGVSIRDSQLDTDLASAMELAGS